MGKSTLDTVAMVLLVIGGLNWGLVGLLNMDLVKLLLGSIPLLQQLVYIVVGLCALYVLYAEFMKK
jgi:uncharacterized membrane protein YuzA (DUF378 family)